MIFYPIRGLFLLLLGTLTLAAWAAPTATVRVAMQDGTALVTDYYLPVEGGPAWPVILMRSTYGRGAKPDQYLSQGYAVVIQDLRGMGESEGEKFVFRADGWQPGLTDGADTVAWIKARGWCNGKIGTVGGSALGITQILMAPATKDVTAQHIDVGATNFYGQTTYQGGVWRKNMMELWLTAIQQPHLIEVYKSHPRYDEFWTYYNAEAKAPEVTAPGLHVGGWYDIFQIGTINGFVSRQVAGGPGARGHQTLIMRPTAHGPYAKDLPYTMQENFDALRVSDVSKDFFAHYLKGEDNGFESHPRVYYYTMGDDKQPDAPGNAWRTANTWPPFKTLETRYYLRPDGELSAKEPGRRAAHASFLYDPANPFPTLGGQNLFLPSGPYDQHTVNAGRTDMLKFATEPLKSPMEVTGQVFVRLYVSSDAPDTDFTAKLVDVFPDGDEREILVLDNIQRVKYRSSFKEAAPPLNGPEDVVPITIDLWHTSWVFHTGHRIGLQISSSNYPRFEKNPNTGDDFPDENNLRKATNTVHFSRKYPSALILPLRDLKSDDDGNGLSVAEDWEQGKDAVEVEF